MNKEITKIVITGGPCGGKSSVLGHIKNHFTQKGYNVVLIPETATELILGGIAPWSTYTNRDFQHTLLKLQLEKERIFTDGALLLKDAEKILLVCDRGAMDNYAYITDEDFAHILSEMGLTSHELLNRYDAVFHLATAAKGNMGYTLSNNNARRESVQEAIKLDSRLLEAWKNHPYHKLVPNTSSFEGKIKCIIDEISVFLSKQ